MLKPFDLFNPLLLRFLPHVSVAQVFGGSEGGGWEPNTSQVGGVLMIAISGIFLFYYLKCSNHMGVWLGVFILIRFGQ
jgi:hypothetical protein